MVIVCITCGGETKHFGECSMRIGQ